MSGKRPVLLLSMFVFVPAASVSTEKQTSIDLALDRTASALVHRYAVSVAGKDAGTPLEYLAVEVRGEKPAQVLAPAGWSAAVGPSASEWGCNWRVVWEPKPGTRLKRSARVAGFQMTFGPKGPSAWCIAQYRFHDRPSEITSGTDAIPKPMR